MKKGKFLRAGARAALLLAGLATTALTEEARTPPALESLDEVSVVNEQERQRQNPRARVLYGPDTVAIRRAGVTTVRLRPAEAQREIRFRRESVARLPTRLVVRPMTLQSDRLTAGAGPSIANVALELAAGIDEADGLPALVPFGARTSLINLEYLRLRDTDRATAFNVSFALDPESRKCLSSLDLVDSEIYTPYRFILLGDRLGDCQSAVKNRESDLLFADGVPEPLKQHLRDIYQPVYSHFAARLGSEPALMFVVWRPESSRDDFRLELGWSRTRLLVFNGATWEKGVDPRQQDELWKALALEQIKRRLTASPDAFTQAAVNYLFLLAEAERNHTTRAWLTTALPGWISSCARDMETSRTTAKTTNGYSLGCGLVLQFVYDAATRARSGGKDTVHVAWRTLLAESYRRNEFGVQPKAFLDSSGDALRIMQVLLGSTIDWSRFGSELDRIGVRLRITQPQPTISVQSLPHFRD